MSEPIWNRFLTERDRAVFAAAGYGARAGFGNRPALLVIDVNYNFCGDRSEPILDSIKRWRNSCGTEAWDGVARIRELIDAAHAQGVPVIYTTGVRRADNWDSGSWSWKNSRTGERPLVAQTERDGNEIEKIVLENAYHIPGLWWARSVVHWAKVRNYVAPPNHYSNQKLQDVWLAED